MSPNPPPPTGTKTHTTRSPHPRLPPAAPAGKTSPFFRFQLELKREMVLRSGEEVHENKRLAVQETGRNTGSFDTFIRYLETEGPSIYAVIAGPVIFRRVFFFFFSSCFCFFNSMRWLFCSRLRNMVW